jgi:hypothetical protein
MLHRAARALSLNTGANFRRMRRRSRPCRASAARTVAAIAAFAHGERGAILDGNVSA